MTCFTTTTSSQSFKYHQPPEWYLQPRSLLWTPDSYLVAYCSSLEYLLRCHVTHTWQIPQFPEFLITFSSKSTLSRAFPISNDGNSFLSVAHAKTLAAIQDSFSGKGKEQFGWYGMGSCRTEGGSRQSETGSRSTFFKWTRKKKKEVNEMGTQLR